MKMKKEYRHLCYGNKIIARENTCSNDNCKWLIPCKILCDYKIDMFEYSLVNLLIDILPRSEITGIFTIRMLLNEKNFITYNKKDYKYYEEELMKLKI